MRIKVVSVTADQTIGGKFSEEELTHDQKALLTWAREQRRLHITGHLSAAQVSALEQIPGWSWNEKSGPVLVIARA
jgi:hypothetical protein